MHRDRTLVWGTLALAAACASSALLLPAAGCVGGIDTPARDDGLGPRLDVQQGSVVGGREVSTCDWPSTVRVIGASQCTGTLIHTRVVTTAAHCLSGSSARVVFGGPRDASAFTLTARCRAGARGSSGVSSGNDWGYCVLPEDPRVAALPVTPPLVGCEAQRFLKPGARAWVVGYGTTGPRGQGAGIKREVEVMINAIDRPRGTIDVGDATVGACHGDSGGPLYLHLLDGQGQDYGYRVIGSTSGPGARSCDCTCSTSYVNIATHIAELERSEGIDVTPCTDADGAWAPGPACRALPSARMRASGAFPSCTVPRTLAPIETCGPSGAPSEGDAGAAADGGAPIDGGQQARDAGELSPDPDRAGESDAAARERDASEMPLGEDGKEPDRASDEDEEREPDEDEEREPDERGQDDEDDEPAEEGDPESDESYDIDRSSARASSEGCSLHQRDEANAPAWLLLVIGVIAHLRLSSKGRRRSLRARCRGRTPRQR